MRIVIGLAAFLINVELPRTDSPPQNQATLVNVRLYDGLLTCERFWHFPQSPSNPVTHETVIITLYSKLTRGAPRRWR